MAVLRMKEIREMTREQRLARLEDLKNELTKQRITLGKSSMTSGIKIREIKRAIARIHTAIREEELGIRKTKAK
ncbi:MAG: 50S ribosomal protein L29 [Candidatus Korarchaeota archaeon]